MQKLRELLVLVLVALLPFHAFLVTVGTKLIAGPGHAPMTALALWKEALLGVILLLASIEWLKKRRVCVDRIDVLIIILLTLSVIVTAVTHGDWKLYAYGFKYDFVPLVAFLVLRRVPWSKQFMGRAFKALLMVGVILSAYAMASAWLPQSFFTALGYSDLHSLYTPDGPLAAYQQIEGVPIRRAQSTFSGPNQFGLWSLLPLSIALLHSAPVVGVFTLLGMFLSMSRAAVLSAFILVTIVCVWRFNRNTLLRIVGGILGASVLIGALGMQLAPQVVTRTMSSSGHISRPLEAIQTIIRHPLGLGLGMAGPASNRVSDTCVHLPENSDASWASDRPNLCVFVGEAQVQPNTPCSCPVLPENWYLQIGIEMGVLGMALFIALIVMILLALPKEHPVFLAFLGISIASLFLHAWEDSAIAYGIWVLACATLAPVSDRAS